MSELDVEPGHESRHLDGTECLSIPAVVRKPRFDPFEWWYGYRASLLTRAYLADDLTPVGRLRLSLELLAVTAIAGVFWTGVVFAGLVFLTMFL